MAKKKNNNGTGYKKKEELTILGVPLGTVILTVIGWFVLNKK